MQQTDFDKIDEIIKSHLEKSHSVVSGTVSSFGSEVIKLKENVSNIQTKIDTSVSIGGWAISGLGALLLLIGGLMTYAFNDYKTSDTAKGEKTTEKLDNMNIQLTEVVSILKSKKIIMIDSENSLTKLTQ